jgi:proteasome lid subunit RPN8/RPN11
MVAYRYALELFAEDGRLLGQVPVDPDWEAALEWAAFAAVRRGLLPALAAAPPGDVEPLWDAARGRPFVAGFRVRVAGAELGAATDLPVTYFWPQAQRAAAAFVESGGLQAGAPFYFRVHAFAARAAAAANDDGAFSVDEVRLALPIDEQSLAPLVGASMRSGAEAETDEIPVFVPRPVLNEVRARAREHPDVEIGGILVGALHRDPDLPEIFLEVTAQIPARHALSHATKVTFTAETWAAADAAIALRRRGEIMCGWYHSHPDWCRRCPIENRRRCTVSSDFFSADDVHLHRVCFARAYHVALLISDNINSGMTWSLYAWRLGLVTRRGFHIIEDDMESMACPTQSEWAAGPEREIGSLCARHGHHEWGPVKCSKGRG